MYIKEWKNMTAIEFNGKKYILFFGYKAPFSNMHNKKIEYQSKSFKNAEQIFAYKKAESFAPEMMDAILKTKTGFEAKKLGSKVPNFNKDLWNTRRITIMDRIIYQKFQDSELAKILKLTEDAELIEVSPYDSYWGAGVDKDQMIELIKKGQSYPGKNTLGKTLMAFRKYHL